MNKKKLILIAEDDVSIRTVLSTELESKYDLKLTDNCAQLWNWVSDGLGDLIILDVMMPDENGLELIPKIKEIRPDLKIIVISAQNTILTAMQAVEKGAYEYLAKPFDLIELNKVIDIAFSDDKNIYYSSSIDSPFGREYDLRMVSINGGMSKPLNYGMIRNISIYNKNPKQKDYLGNWYTQIDKINMYRDDNGCERIGKYLKCLQDGFNSDLNCKNSIKKQIKNI